MLTQGLMLVGFENHRIQNVSRVVNLERFRAHYGSNPIVYAQIWEDLQTTAIPDAQIDNVNADLSMFLMSIHFLKGYATEAVLAATFRICEKTVRKWRWFFASKIQALKAEKVRKVFVAAVVCVINHCTLMHLLTPHHNRLYGPHVGFLAMLTFQMLRMFLSSC